MILTLTIPNPVRIIRGKLSNEKPKGKDRHRSAGRNRMFTPAETKRYEKLVVSVFDKEYPDHEPWTGALGVSVTAWFGIPKSTSKKNRALMYAGVIRPTVSPDRDNIDKIILDALNPIKGRVKGKIRTIRYVAWLDDAQICEGPVEKRYITHDDDPPRVDVQIWKCSEYRSIHTLEKYNEHSK